ncbi:hypothetical protein GGD56_006221 [Rhizobium mongolense]|jgi:hypothetical protein|uniref:Uncharacterized protein n=1 Tax=Rhizobium mongolense TaxID=57676 RepID=A0ABR6IXC3_9HYPH|nr:hypothetical protein [Rhizobium mongolense]
MEWQSYSAKLMIAVIGALLIISALSLLVVVDYGI